MFKTHDRTVMLGKTFLRGCLEKDNENYMSKDKNGGLSIDKI